MNMQFKQILDSIYKEKNITPKKEVLLLIRKIKEKIEDSEKNEIIKCILNYFSTDKPWKNEEFSTFSEKLCKLNYEDDNVEVILKVFEQFNGNLKYLISIDDIIKNKYINCALKFKLLSGEKKDLIDYIIKIKNVFKKEKEIQKILLMIYFDNYIQINFFHELLRILFLEADIKENSNILEKIILNINKKEFLRCEKCFDILYCYEKNNLFNFICNNNHLISLLPNQEKIEKIITIKCQNCESKKNIYENIFKCLSCESFICETCKNNHEKKCFLCQYINLYQIGYLCEKHNKLYEDCCFFCYKNLCIDCKSRHFHMSKPIIKKLLISEVEILKLMNINEKYTVKDYINYQYAIILKFTQKNAYFNFKIYNSLNFLNGYSRVNKIDDFYSNFFGDEEFLLYYKDLIENIKKGDLNALASLETIKDNYKKLQKYSNSKSQRQKYNTLRDDSEKVRQNRIKLFIKNIKYLLIKTKKSYFRIKKAINEISGKKEIIRISNEFNFFKIKNVALQNSNKLGEIYLGNLISRYLSDLIIAQLINKYPTYFKPIQLSFKNLYELLKNYGEGIINENTKERMNLLFKKITSLIKDSNFNSKEFLDIFKSSNDISFAYDLVINDSIIKKEELNFILELFIFFKKNGNELAHPNIDKMKASFIKFINKDFISENITNDDTNSIFNTNANTNINTNSNFNLSIEKINSFIKTDSDLDHKELENKIKKKLKKLVEMILNEFKEITYNKEININQILNFMLKNNSNEIIKNNSLMLRILRQEIDKIIDEKNNIDLNQFGYYHDIINDFNNNIMLLESELNDIKINLFEQYFNDFYKKINISINDLQTFDMYKIESILDSFFSEISEYSISENDINSIALFIIGNKILMMKSDFNLEKIKLGENIEEIIFEESISNKIERIYVEIEQFFSKKKYYDSEEDLIKKIKLKIKDEKKNASLISLDINIKKIYEILQKVIGIDKIKWLESPISKDISLDTYLYYKQNII